MSKTNGVFVGVDMGGTDIKATVSAADGRILVDHIDKILSLVSEGPERTVEQLAIAAETALRGAGASWDDVVAVGLDTPGPASVDGVLARSANLKHPGWENFAIRAAFEKRLAKPVVYANDANAAGYWEYFRVYKDDRSKILGLITLGTGLGGALVIGGELIVGSLGYAAEFGHMRLVMPELVRDEDIPRCGCGQRGCAEIYASLAALDHFLRRALAKPEHKDHPLQQIPDEGRARAVKLLGLAQKGDALSQQLFDQQADAVGMLFVNLANAFDPHILLIGGGITEANEAFCTRYLERVRAAFARGAFAAQAKQTRIEYAGDQDQAGARGSALLARQFALKNGL